MDVSAFPARAVLRWDLGVRVVLAVVVPLGLAGLARGSYTDALLVGLIAALVSLSSLGPDIGSLRWSVVAALSAPLAAVLAAWGATLPTGGLLAVFGLYLVFGAFIQAGIVAQMAWFPVATTGLLVAVLTTDGPTWGIAVRLVAGSAWALVLILVVPRLIGVPRLPIPATATQPDTALLRRMVTRPSVRDWGFPLLLGAASAVLLQATQVITGGFRPYWAVLAFASVLGPVAAKTRASAAETVAATLLGIALAVLVASLGLPNILLLGLALLLVVPGALLLLLNGLVSKVCLTPLPIVMVALVIDEDLTLVAGYRLVEYLIGALAGLVAAGLAEWLTQRMEAGRAGADALPVA